MTRLFDRADHGHRFRRRDGRAGKLDFAGFEKAKTPPAVRSTLVMEDDGKRVVVRCVDVTRDLKY